MRYFKLFSALLLGLLLLAAAAFAALIFVDPTVFRNQLEASATAAFGRAVRFGGPIRLERSLQPRIVIENITIDNPEWASEAHFAAAEKVGVQVALFPLLWGDLKVLDVRFSGVMVFLEEGLQGADNYTFADRGGGKEHGVLPSVEQILIQDAVITYRSANASVSRYEINKARLWNIPGEPERIEAEGSAKGVPFRIHLAADTPAENTGPHLPWSARLEVRCPDLALIASGRVAQVFDWSRFDLRIALKGDRPDTIENLFDVDLGGIGAFEITGSLTAAEGVVRMTDIAAHVQGPSGTPDITIVNGAASGGPETPLHVELQGKYGDAPLALTFSAERIVEVSSQKAPWPMAGRLQAADAQFDFKGTVVPAAAGTSVELDAILQGESLDALARFLGYEPPKAGPYRFSFRTHLDQGGVHVTGLEGHILGFAPWKTIQIVKGDVSARKGGLVKASIDAELDRAPLTLSFQGGPQTTSEPNTTAWPVQLEASGSGAVLTADGSVVADQGGSRLQLATRVKGDRLDALGSLVGVSLPRIARYDLRARVASGDGVHELRDLAFQVGANRLTGAVRWDGTAPRPRLTGRLSLGRVTLGELLDAASKTSSQKRPPSLPDRPIRLDGLHNFDVNLDLDVSGVADSPIAIEKVVTTLTVAKGTLAASFRGRVAGADLKGQLELARRSNRPTVSLKAAVGRIDAGQTLRQLNLPDILAGTVDAVQVDGRSTGETLHALLEQADITVQIKPASLSCSGNMIPRKVDVTLASAELAVRKGRPVTAALTGTLNRVPFDATLSAGTLAELYRTDAPLPVRLTLQAADVQLRAEGTVARPFHRLEFDLEHELTGKEIKGLDPLMDIVLPLRGEFYAKGRVSAHGNRFTYEEDLRVGKSDLKAAITVLHVPTRPKIEGRIQAGELHLNDVALSDGNEDAGPAKDALRVILDHTIPTDIFLAADLDLAIGAERIITETETLGDLVSKVKLQNGRYHSSSSIAGGMGGRIGGELDIDAATQPLSIRIRLDAKDLDYRFLQQPPQNSDLIKGSVDLYVRLSGAGATMRSLLGNADGRVTVIGGPSRISGRRLDLWAADLIPTMLSPRWQRENVTEMNCIAAKIELKQGLAKLESLILDTQRITITGSGTLNLETEALDLNLAPRPKRPSLVSLANPVTIRGTLAKPDVSVAQLPSRRRLLRTGLLAGLINPAFLLIAFSDTGTGVANPCGAAIERAYEAAEVDAR
jgi:uncharacterized protein involved in outer membrane biogenesis